MHDQFCPAACRLHQFGSSRGQGLCPGYVLGGPLGISGKFIDGLFQMRSHLFDRVTVSRRIEHTLLLDNEEASLLYYSQGVIRLPIVGDPLADQQMACRFDFFTLLYFNRQRLGHGVHIDQHARGFQQAVNFFKGMNHAAIFHSTQGLRHDHDVEDRWWAGSGKVFECDVLKFEAVF